jgi:hypothetical protein
MILRLRLIILALLTGAAIAQAHDPYEITSVVYLHSNRIELLAEMEFSTGMRLAGIAPTRTTPAADQFAAAQPQLQTAAGAWLQFTAGNNALLARRTNVQLGVEDHIRFQVEFAPTALRPLRVAAPGLRALSELGPYGTSLTVLDMVNQKVVGQTTLFAGSPVAEFTPLPPASNPPPQLLPPPPAAAPVAAPNPPPGASPAPPARRGPLLWLGVAFVVAWWVMHRRSRS